MMHRALLAVVGSLVVVTQAGFVGSPIASKNGVMMQGYSKALQGLISPKQLLIKNPFGKMGCDNVLCFEATSDRTIRWEGKDRCIEAAGDKKGDGVRLSDCTDERAQKWNWIPDGKGGNLIQLQDTNLCLETKSESLRLQECQQTGGETWKFEAPSFSLNESSPFDLRYFAMSLIALAGLGAASLSTVHWRRGAKARAFAMSHGSACVDEGGVFLSAPLNSSEMSTSTNGPSLHPLTLARNGDISMMAEPDDIVGAAINCVVLPSEAVEHRLETSVKKVILSAPTINKSRTSLSRRSLLASSGLALGACSSASSAATVAAPPKVTDRIFLDIRVITSFSTEVLEDSAVRGRLTFGLFGGDAPLGTKKFLSFVDGDAGTFAKSGGGPTYMSARFNRMITPGVGLKPSMIEGGSISGLQLTEFGGQEEYEFNDRVLFLKPVLEANDLKHDRRGLLTRELFNPGPEFGLTLDAAPQLDGTREVIGQLEPGEENDKLLALLEGLPYISGVSREGQGTAANAIFQEQLKFFSDLAKAAGDDRAQEDRTGKLLRRVEFTRCGRL